MSGLINKVKDALHSDKDKTHEQPEGTHGTHNSRAANAADPRIDSDRDHRANPTGHTTTGHTTGGLGSTGTHSENLPGHSAGHTTTGGLGSTGHTGYSENLPEGSVGPHSSRAANAADPRVDSDLDSSRRHGAGGIGGTTGGIGGATGSHGSHGLGGTTGTTGSHGIGGHTGTAGHTGGLSGTGATGGYSGRDNSLPEGSVGPHSSRAANAADPRVDSDLDSSRRHGAGGIGGTTGGIGSHGNTYDQTTTGTSGLSSHGAGAHGPSGTHSSGLSGTHGSTGTHGAGVGGAASGYGTGPGPAPNTAGPHKSDALNKADPRVDSDLDGSKTVGKEKTFDQSGTNFAGRDPTDAAQVPPSIMQKHVPTEIAHDDPTSDHGRRHSSVNKEHHTGL